MDNIKRNLGRRTVNRALSLLLALCLALSLIPALPGTAWAAPAEDTSSDDLVKNSLDTLVEWGVMRGDTDGGLYPDRSLTRAEFTAMVNRAYGYDAVGKIPFTDVDEKAWYADDIAIAYNTGYFNGTSPTTASPNRALTREEALILLTRSLRLEEIPGQVAELSDGDAVSNWARGYVRAAAQAGLISDEGGKGFRPTDTMTRGEMAALLTRSVGTLVQDGGEHALGDVFGNVTVNQAGTTLKDTVIAGDLYITGGLGLGAVTLENTTVLGKIVVAGGGVSEKGEDSVILRSVEAESLVVDSIRNQYNSVRAEGDTSIQNATMRTSAFVQDRSLDGFGLLNLTLDGRGPDMSFTVSGNLKDVVNKTPDSTLTVSDGSAQQLTIDEAATNSALTIERGGLVHQLNLDASLEVTGGGDVQSLQVSAPDSKVEMLPEQISIRPGLTANIFGEDMDNQQAHESSSSPRLLAGYPKVKNIASQTATAVFAGNKPGTVYWAVSAQSDGSISEEDLLNPGSYGNKAILQGNVNITAATEEFEAAIRSLSASGSYYLSAILVDARGNRSPVKVVAFGTPDDSVPAFAQGYPRLSRIGIGTGSTGTSPADYSTQALAMTTKSCVLFYALFPSGSKAPTANDFKNGSLNGNLGSGSRTVIRNTEIEIMNVNREKLKEKTKYDLYFWLNDIDGVKSSNVVKLSFETPDCTNPKFVTDPFVTKTQATSVTATGSIDEAGTVFWVAVKKGTHYPKAPSGQVVEYGKEEEFAEFLKTPYAKIQVENAGGSPLKSGKVSAQGNKDFNFTVSGLTAETAYDIYYVAKDSAGNYSDTVKVLTVNTEDNVPPTATLRFDKFANNDPSTPFANTDIDIVFSETIAANNEANGDLVALYQKVTSAANGSTEQWAAKEDLAEVLSKIIKLYNITGTNLPAEVTARTHNPDGTIATPADKNEWTIDYYNAQILMDDTDPEGRRMIVRFVNKDNNDPEGAIKLKSGSTYYFELSGITDTAAAPNIMGTTRLPKDSAGRDSQFTTISAQMIFDGLNLIEDINYVIDKVDGSTPTPSTDPLPVDEFDMAFTMIPRSTKSVEDNINWELLFWSDTTVKFELFYKLPGENQKWHKAPNEALCQVPSGTTSSGTTLHRGLRGLRVNPLLVDLQDEQPYEFVIHFTEVGGSSTRGDWSKDVTFIMQAVAGSNHEIDTQAQSMINSVIIDALKPPIGTSDPIVKRFRDKNPPLFSEGYPFFDIADSKGTMRVQTNRPAVVYWAVAPETAVTTKFIETKDGPDKGKEVNANSSDARIPHMSDVLTGKPELVTDTGKADPKNPFVLTVPTIYDITEPNFSNEEIKTGRLTVGSGAMDIPLKDITPNTNYFAYFVLQGPDGGAMSEKVMLYKFKTQDVIRPIIELDVSNPTVYISSNVDAKVDHVLVQYTSNKLNSLLAQDFQDVIDEKYYKKDDKGNLATPTDSRLKHEYVEPLQSLLTAAMTKNENDMEAFGNKFTVLMAMATDVPAGSSGSKGCLFDQYATYKAQQDVAGYIRSTTAGSTGEILEPHHDVTVTADARKEVRCGDYALSETGRYAFLAIGRTQDSTDENTSGWSFRAYYPIYKSDEVAPQISTITGTFKYGTDSDKNGTITGTISLGFTEDLYHYDKNSLKFYQLDQGSINVSGRDDGWESIADIATASPGAVAIVVTDDSKVGKPISSIEVYVNNLKAGSSATLTIGSGLADDSTNNWGKITLTFQFRQERVPDTTSEDPDATKVVSYVLVSAPSSLLSDDLTVAEGIQVK